MAIRFSFRDALEGMVHVAAGTLAGKIQGIQMQQEQQNKAMQMSQMLQEQQHRKSQEQMQALGLLGKGGFEPTKPVQSAIPGIAPEVGQGLNMVGSTGLVPGMIPGTGSILPQPTSAQPTVPTYETPIGRLQQTQVSNDDLKEIKSSASKIQNVLAKADPNDPNSKFVQQSFAQINLNPTTPDEVADTKNKLYHLGLLGANYREPASRVAGEKVAAKTFNTRWDTLSAVTNPREGSREAVALLGDYDTYKEQGIKLPAYIEAHRGELETIKNLLEKEDYKGADAAFKVFQGGLSQLDNMPPGERNQAFNNLFKYIDRLTVDDLSNPDKLKKVAKSVGLNSIAGLSNNDILSFYRSRAEKEYEDLLKLLPRLRELPPTEQSRIVEGLDKYGKIAGKPVLDPKQFGPLSEEAQAKLVERRQKEQQRELGIQEKKQKIAEQPQIAREREARIKHLNAATNKLNQSIHQKKVSKDQVEGFKARVKDAELDVKNYMSINKDYLGGYIQHGDKNKGRQYREELDRMNDVLDAARASRDRAIEIQRQSTIAPSQKSSSQSNVKLSNEDRLKYIRGAIARGKNPKEARKAAERYR